MRRGLVVVLVLGSCGGGTRAPLAPPRPAVLAGRPPDLDGNGYADLAIGAPGTRPEERGRVFVHLGGATGWRPAPDVVLVGPDAAGAAYGAALAAGDVDGDGLAELAVGAPGADDLAGRVYVYKGGARGLAAAPWRVLTAPDGPGGRFGAALAAAGDLTGDGLVDLVVGAPDAAGGGRVHVFAGAAAGLAEKPAASYGGSGRFGAAVAGAGDVNGDHIGELLVGAPEGAFLAGQVSLLAGGAELLVLAGADGKPEHLGAQVAGVGDLNGDGLADVVLAAPLADRGRGRLEVHRGGHDGLAAAPSAVISNPDGPEGEDARLGVSIAAAGDVDGDGLADFVAGESRYRAFTGRVHYYRGSRGVQLTRPARSWTGPAGTYASFGAVVAGGGDADGDGFAEIVVAAPGARRVFVYAGGADGPADAPTRVIPAPAGSPGGFGTALVVTR